MQCYLLCVKCLKNYDKILILKPLIVTGRRGPCHSLPNPVNPLIKHMLKYQERKIMVLMFMIMNWHGFVIICIRESMKIIRNMDRELWYWIMEWLLLEIGIKEGWMEIACFLHHLEEKYIVGLSGGNLKVGVLFVISVVYK